MGWWPMVRTALTPAEVDEVWRRWRSGQAVKVLAREMRRAPVDGAGSAPAHRRDPAGSRGGGGSCGCRWPSGRRSPAAWRPGCRCGRSPAAWAGRRRRSSREVAGNGGRGRLSGAGRRPRGVGPSRPAEADASWPGGRGCGPWSRTSWSCVGRRSRSPAGCSRRFPTGTVMHVSHETIYRSLFVQSRGDLRHELTRHLRTGRAMRRPAGARLPDGRGLRPNILQHLRTAGRGRGPGGARALGGRPGLRPRHEPGRHPGRTLHPVSDAGRPAGRDTRPNWSPTRWPRRSPRCRGS